MRSFPESFRFGAATSAYQIEGDIENDWSLWERAGRLKDPNARCGLASDHWNRWEADVELLADLGAEAYRFSVEWARIEPKAGQYDEAALARYVALVEALNHRGIEPFVTLLHFTHPPWFHGRCPWHAGPEAVDRFEAFTRKVAAAFGDRVRFYTVINEPSVWLAAAYVKGAIPPGRRSVRELAEATLNLLRAHGRACAAIKAVHAGAQIGVASHYMHFTPSRANPLDALAARYVAHHFNHTFVEALQTGVAKLGRIPGIRIVRHLPEAEGTLDFVGVNFYSRVFVEITPKLGFDALSVFYEDREGRGISDLGWEIHPRGLFEALQAMSRYHLPIYVTENGIDDRDDSRRAAFIHDHLGATLDAIDAGIDVRGYLHWSLFDNFEWLEAFGPRFGLYRVDYETFERASTRGAEYYRSIIRSRQLNGSRPEERKKRGVERVFPV